MPTFKEAISEVDEKEEILELGYEVGSFFGMAPSRLKFDMFLWFERFQNPDTSPGARRIITLMFILGSYQGL